MLTLPANGATQVSAATPFSWEAVNDADTYTIEIATDPAFSHVVASANGIAATSWTPGSELSFDTLYYWRVWAVNSCGQIGTSTVAFRTVAATCSVYNSTDVPKRIPALGTSGTATSVLQVSNGGSILDVNVLNLAGSHSHLGDLTFGLTSPAATDVWFMTPSCEATAGFDLNLDDEAAPGTWPCPPVRGGLYRPSSPLAAYDGENSTGAWTLTRLEHRDIC